MRILIIGLMLALPVSAQVYKCEVNGAVTYSQIPCADDAQVTDYSRSAEEVAPQQTESSATLDRLTNSVKKRDMAEKIKRLERQRERQMRDRDAEVAEIASRKGKVARNLAGNLYEDSLSSDIIAATAIWNTRIDTTTKQIDKLKSEYEKL